MIRGLLPLAVVIAAAGCASAPPAPQLLHPYKVVLLPVEGAKDALEAKRGADDVPLALTADQLAAKIRDSIVSSHVFSEVVPAKAEDLRAPGVEDEVAAASDLARRTESDLILRVQVKSARMTDLGNNNSTFWSTLTWFMIPLPVWFVDDRSYATDIKVQAELYDPDDPVKPTASVVAASGKQDLDLWDRGLSPFVIVVPPPFLKGSAKSVSEKLTERAVSQLLGALVKELSTREIPSRFEMTVSAEGATVRIAVSSRRRLRSLEVEADGRSVATWAETGLVEEKDSTPERFVYRRDVAVKAKPGAQVRVIADDEAGGREVRTLVLSGGAK